MASVPTPHPIPGSASRHRPATSRYPAPGTDALDPVPPPAPVASSTGDPPTTGRHKVTFSKRVPRVVVPATRAFKFGLGKAADGGEAQAQATEDGVSGELLQFVNEVAQLRGGGLDRAANGDAFTRLDQAFDDLMRTARDEGRMQMVLHVLGPALGEAYLSPLPDDLSTAIPRHALALGVVMAAADRLERSRGLRFFPDDLEPAIQVRLIAINRALSGLPEPEGQAANWALIDPWGPLPDGSPEPPAATTRGVAAFIVGVLRRLGELDSEEAFRQAGRVQAAAIHGAGLDQAGKAARAVADLLLFALKETSGFDAYRQPGRVASRLGAGERLERALWDSRSVPVEVLGIIAALAERHRDQGMAGIVHGRLLPITGGAGRAPTGEPAT